MKKPGLFSVVAIFLIVSSIYGCSSDNPPPAPDNRLIVTMTEHARTIIEEEYSNQYDLDLLAVFASVDEDNSQLFDTADQLAYWKFVFTDFNAHKSVEVICSNDIWSHELIDDIWMEDAVLNDPLLIVYDIQDALDLISITYPGEEYWDVYFHLPIDPDIKYPQYKFHRESLDFIIFDSITGEFYISAT